VLTELQFARLKHLSLLRAGILLEECHRTTLDKRIARFGQVTGLNCEDILAQVEQTDPQSLSTLYELIATPHTAFFRHPWHFDLAAEHALWIAKRRHRARIWCTAAASGEEPFSMALAAIDIFQNDAPPVDILATDLGSPILQQGRAGCPRHAPSAQVMQRFRRFFEIEGVGGVQLRPPVRSLIEFRELNLVDAQWPELGQWDVVFCRNVLMYLHPDYRDTILRRLCVLLAPDGILLIDPAEHLGQAEPLFQSCGPGAYRVANQVACDKPGRLHR